MTDDDVHSALVRWLSGITGATVIKTHQSGPAPDTPYIAVNMTGTSEIREHAQSVEYTELETVNSQGKNEISAAPVIETEWRFSCHAYGSDPTSILRPIRSAAQVAQKNEPMMRLLVIHEVSQVRNVPDWLNEAWEPRGQIDVILRGLTRDGFVVDTIEDAPFDFQPIH